MHLESLSTQRGGYHVRRGLGSLNECPSRLWRGGGWIIKSRAHWLHGGLRSLRKWGHRVNVHQALWCPVHSICLSRSVMPIVLIYHGVWFPVHGICLSRSVMPCTWYLSVTVSDVRHVCDHAFLSYACHVCDQAFSHASVTSVRLSRLWSSVFSYVCHVCMGGGGGAGRGPISTLKLQHFLSVRVSQKWAKMSTIV